LYVSSQGFLAFADPNSAQFFRSLSLLLRLCHCKQVSLAGLFSCMPHQLVVATLFHLQFEQTLFWSRFFVISFFSLSRLLIYPIYTWECSITSCCQAFKIFTILQKS
jgi:hypothetical protein